jgi:Mg2+ and Co2+ transporter CorA
MPDLHSHHIFLFPFKFKNTDQVSEKISEKWTKEGSFSLNTAINYNEYHYFLDFTRHILYDLGNKNSFLTHYEYKDLCLEGEYIIKIKDKTFTLNIDSILLNIYKGEIGVLSFHLNNRKYSNPADILMINQYGRRIYPPFFEVKGDLVGSQAAFYESAATFGSEVATQISLQKGTEKLFCEDFTDFKSRTNIDNSTYIPQFIGKLIFGKAASEFPIQPIMDDRMFVVSWLGNDEKAASIGKNSDVNSRKIGEYRYKTNNWWYRYVFVDGTDKTCQNDEMSEALQTDATNARWVDYETLYGVTRYSFVSLTRALTHLKKPHVNAAFLVTHTQTMYYKMVELVLVQRAYLLQFSEKVAQLADLGSTINAKEVEQLHKAYIEFVNKIYFREITAQEQGMELYNLLQQQMDITRQVQALNGEIQELFNLTSLLEEEKRNQKLDNLTYIGSAFAIASLILSVFGLNYFGKDGIWVYPTWSWASNWELIGSVGWIIGITIGLTLLTCLFFYSVPKIWLELKKAIGIR